MAHGKAVVLRQASARGAARALSSNLELAEQDLAFSNGFAYTVRWTVSGPGS
eukprot:CAMPEP_0174699888 /NCGR_PEP_ID=MMETSP1094-20130205/5024_1 /TAXON_ID=156173 /ORGANISM="Chrysochromulina brevifilum, Strain UTEX LB 985" /LENGTH=51 /DNA_ID=CAMNT_0015897295 /DNA_START=204 /DNA_END=356 /DNA_ORIENTATION=+